MTLSAPDMLLTAAVTLLAVLISLFFVVGVGRARQASQIDAPAMSGDPRLERALRIQANTVEQFVVFVPSLWLAAVYFQGWVPPLLGLVWCIGRIIYAYAYGDHKKRLPGFALTIFPTLLLVILTAVGIVQAFMANGS